MSQREAHRPATTSVRVVNAVAAHMPGITALVNEAMAGVPPYWSLTTDQVRRVVKAPHALWSPHYPEAPPPSVTKTLCALAGDQVLAAAGFSVHGDTAILEWIVGNLPQPLMLLAETLNERLDSSGCRTIRTGRFAFGGGWFGLWAGWVAAQALRLSGWTVTRRWHLYTLDFATFPPQDPVPGLTTGWHMNRAAGEWTLNAFEGNDEIATCEVWAIPDVLDDHPAYGQWVNLEYLGVEAAALRRRGIARHLLMEQLRFQIRRGVRNSHSCVEVGNVPAHTLAEAIGSRYVGDGVELQAILPR